MESVVYNELVGRKKPTASIESVDCFELIDFNMLFSQVTNKFPTAKYVHVEALWEPEENAQVFNLMFFDDSETIIGGCEITPLKIFWDDDEEEV